MCSVHLGLGAEAWVMDQLIKRGYSPKVPRYHAPYDLVVGDLPIEVKFARPSRRYVTQSDGRRKYYTRWQWFIHPTTHNEIDGEWVLILVGQDKSEQLFTYILPGSLIAGRNQLQITRHPDKFRGWLSKWRNKWDVIAYLCQQTYLNNGPLFQKWEGGKAA